MENQGKIRLGPIGWVKMHVLRCPRCGTKLIRQIATDESAVVHGYTGGTFAPMSPNLNSGDIDVETRITPVYLVCPCCGLRVHVKNING